MYKKHNTVGRVKTTIRLSQRLLNKLQVALDGLPEYMSRNTFIAYVLESYMDASVTDLLASQLHDL